tara:strand:- start:1784 stop:2797 length:1014 start_codon:yes stop_codon:yes gene_type:complete
MVTDLSGRASNGTLCFDKYVTSKKDWKNIVYKTIKACNITDSSGNTRFNIAADENIQFVSAETVKIKRHKYCAEIKANNITGYIPLINVAKPSCKDVMESEKKSLEDLQKLFENGPINIITPEDGAIYMNCCKAEEVTQKIRGRSVKADYVIEDSSGNKLLWLSHKKGTTAKEFQQYGGLSDKAGSESNKDCICEHPEVKDFLKKATEYHDGERIKHAVYRCLIDDDLVGKSVFGPDYNTTNPKFGPDFCQFIVQGKPSLKKSNQIENCYEIEWSGITHSWNNVQIFTETDNNYRAVMGITFKNNRNFKSEDKKYKGSRAGIYAHSYIQGRSDCKEI